MNLKKIIMVGLLAEAGSFVIGNILYMNPWVAAVYSASSAAYCAKPMEPFMDWLLLMFAGGIISSILVTLLYSYTEKGLNIKPAWKKGLSFGFLFWAVAGLPTAYNTWLLHSYPDMMIAVEAVNGLIGALVAGTIIGIAYERIK